MPIGLIAIAALAVIVLLIIVSNIHIVQQSRAYVIERLGAFSKVWQVGIHVKVLHFVLAEHLHTIGVGAHAALVPIQAEPDPVENGQFILLHHIGKALIEPRLEHHAAGVDAGGVFLAAAGGHQLGVELASLPRTATMIWAQCSLAAFTASGHI